MSERWREAVSALADGEASELELRQILARSEDPELRQFWRSCHLQHAASSACELRFSQVDLSAGVAAALAAEPVPRGAPRRWLRPLGGTAVAASVALAVVFGGGAFDTGGPLPSPEGSTLETAAAPTGSRVYPVGGGASARGSVPVIAGVEGNWPRASGAGEAAPPAVDEEAQRQLQRYLLRHTERAAVKTGQGLLSFARVSHIEPE